MFWKKPNNAPKQESAKLVTDQQTGDPSHASALAELRKYSNELKQMDANDVGYQLYCALLSREFLREKTGGSSVLSNEFCRNLATVYSVEPTQVLEYIQMLEDWRKFLLSTNEQGFKTVGQGWLIWILSLRSLVVEDFDYLLEITEVWQRLWMAREAVTTTFRKVTPEWDEKRLAEVMVPPLWFIDQLDPNRGSRAGKS
jgi:hypothetical protein